MRRNQLPIVLLWTMTLVAASTAFAQQSEPGLRFRRMGGFHGVGRYVPGAWAVVAVDVANPTNEGAEAIAAFSFSKNPEVQYARKIWVPPRSLRRTWAPIQVPQSAAHQGVVEMYGKLIDVTDGTEVVLKREGERTQHQRTLPVSRESSMMGMLVPEPDPSRSQEIDHAYEAAIGTRVSAGHTRVLALIPLANVTALPLALDGLDQLLIAHHGFADDPTVVLAIRKWLHNGGQLWIMLDRVDTAEVKRLLGGYFPCQEIDRVELSSVQIKSTASGAVVSPTRGKIYERPLNFVRLTTPGMNVSTTVDGWPASFSTKVGRGTAVFTTLDAEAWIERREASRGGDLERWSDFKPTGELDNLLIAQSRKKMAVEPADLKPYLAEQIGYPIAQRSLVMSLLGGFCLTLLGGGLWLARRDRLEWMGWIIPVAVIAATAPLLAFGWASQQTAPPTIGEAQLIEVGGEGDNVTATGLISFYRHQPSAESIGADAGGVFHFDPEEGIEGAPRMVWDDVDAWRWENLRLPAGVRSAGFQRSFSLSEPIRPSGTFSEKGFEGKIAGLDKPVSDALIVVPGQPNLAVSVDETSMAAGVGDVLAEGQHIASGFLTDEQRRRDALYEKVLGEVPGSLTGPTLFAWTSPWDLQFRLSADVERSGAALVMAPLHIESPPPNSYVAPPSSFVTYRCWRNPVTKRLSAAYHHSRGEWIPLESSNAVWLRFQIPRALTPLELDKAVVKLKITAPNRTLEIFTSPELDDPIFSRPNPIGEITFAIEEPSWLRTDDQGGVFLGLSISDQEASSEEQKVQWKIDSLQLDIAGVYRGGD